MTSLRRSMGRAVPEKWKAVVWTLAHRAKTRVLDALPDLRDRFFPGPGSLPPPLLRRRVALNASRAEFIAIGREAATNVEDAFAAARASGERYPRWLDFGCGPGRVARHLSRYSEIEELWGADVDREAIGWAAKSLPGRYVPIAADPPTPSAANHFDVVYAGSVFTHLSEERQLAWLAELHRILRSGGLLIASTHSPSLSFMRPDLTAGQRAELAERGFLFARGPGGFSGDSAYHSHEYLLATWGRLFGMAHFRERGLNQYQDLAVWQKW